MRRFFRLSFLLSLLTGCRDAPPEPTRPVLENVPFEIHGELTFSRDGEPITTIDIEIADTDSTRARGLMARTDFPPATGMLFIFPREEQLGFWMANTPTALDIIYFDADSTLVNVQANAVPFQRSPTYNSDGPAQYVVEVPAGFARRYGLTPGVRIDWTRNDAPPQDSTGASP